MSLFNDLKTFLA